MKIFVKYIILLFIFINFYNCFYVKPGKKIKSNDCPEPYSNCNLGIDGLINVHIVPHTHDDVGWLKTVDQYYYGSNNNEQTASVQYILDTVITELDKDPSKRFVYVEIAFFWRWWKNQDESIKSIVRKLVKEHRLEFVIGAWCMNDEATTYYNDIIDQQTLGLKFILKEFGECARPRSAWQIDPFGHSREQASLFAQFGFDGLFLGRIDYQDFDFRGKTQTREFLWEASANLGKQQSQLFTGVLPNGYNPPGGFCFDAYCGDDPIMDDPTLEDYNVEKKVDDFIQYTLNQRNQYKTNNLIMTMGSDFQYSNAHMWFKNLDKLIYYVNKRQSTNNSNINIFYSTTACYLYSLNKANTTWSIKKDDFFPYAHRPHSFWTGYFTSRAALKNYVRRANNILQVARQFSVLKFDNDTKDISQKAIQNLERAMGVAQHHDAVSGTERQHVANDYAKRLSIGIDQVMKNVIFDKYSNLIHFCPLLNISECNIVEDQEKFGVFIYNPLARSTEHWFRIPVSYDNYGVIDYINQKLVPSEILPIKEETKRIPERNSSLKYELVFKGEFDQLSTNFYYIVRNYSQANTKKNVHRKEELFIQNDHLRLTFDEFGNLNQLENFDSNIKTLLKQNFCIYKSMEGNNSDSQFQASGAYIFRPQSETSDCLNVKNFSIYNGNQFNEIHQIYNDWISQTIRLYKDSKNIEFEWQIGSINVDDNIGKEIVIKFSSDINSQSTFYTDSNGREMLKRVRDFRPTWNLNQTENVAGNYYPINSRIFIRDEKSTILRDAEAQLTLVTDRSQGGSSIEDGSIEIMLHRRVLHDDSLGVSEPLNELGSDKNGLVVKGFLKLIFDRTENSASLHRKLAHQINNEPVLFFAKQDANTLNIKKFENLMGEYNFSITSLPSNLHLLTIMWDYDYKVENTIIIRIEHFYEKDEDPILSKPTTIDLKEIFKIYFNIENVQELSLGANMDVKDLEQRLIWNSNESDSNESLKYNYDSKHSKEFVYTFQPMQIRTFRLFLD